jgi:hypothetical protein
MSEEDAVTAALLEFLNACEDGIAEAKRLISENKGVIEEGNWKPANIQWTVTEGTKGSYERSEDVDSPDFKSLIKDLAQHDGKLSKDDHFYWLFKNGSTVGRKKR